MPFLHVIPEFGFYFNYATAAQRDHRNGAVHVWRDHTVHVDLIAHFADFHRGQRKLPGILHREDIRVGISLYDSAS